MKDQYERVKEIKMIFNRIINEDYQYEDFILALFDLETSNNMCRSNIDVYKEVYRKYMKNDITLLDLSIVEMIGEGLAKAKREKYDNFTKLKYGENRNETTNNL